MKIALLGYGNVGRGAHDALAALPEIEVKRVLVRRIRACGACEATADFDDILNDPEIGLVAEAMGGCEPARGYALAAMKAKKHVVSANKELLSRGFAELYAAAAEHDVCLRHTACAGGGIPWLYNLERAMRCDEIIALGGIMNGTSNFILHAMQKGMRFPDALKAAQALGYAEAEPDADIDGLDAARKCALSANMAFQTTLDERDMDVEGIRFADACDIKFAKERGMVLKLMARAARAGNAVNAYVEPCFMDAASREAGVTENNNLLGFAGRRLGEQSFFGQGAGREPTGVAMAQDILDIARGLAMPPTLPLRPINVDNGTDAHQYYVRCNENAACETLKTLAREELMIGEKHAYVLRPVSVKRMHALVKNLREADPAAFFAGIKEV